NSPCFPRMATGSSVISKASVTDGCAASIQSAERSLTPRSGPACRVLILGSMVECGFLGLLMQHPAVDFDHLLGLCFPAIAAQGVVASGCTEGFNSGGVFNEGRQFSGKTRDELVLGSQGHANAALRRDEPARCAVVDDQAGEPACHGLDDGSRAQLANRREYKYVRFT